MSSESAKVTDSAISHLDKSYNEKAMVYKDETDQRWVIRNSKIGTCPRELWAAWKGMEPAKEDYKAKIDLAADPDQIDSDPAKEGHLHEAHVKSLLEEKGWILSGFEYEFVLIIGDCKIVGHADMGSAIDPRTGIDYFGEVKSMGKEQFSDFLDKGWELYPTYTTQLSVGMLATGKPGIVWVKCRDNGKILPPFIFNEPPVSRVEIMRKVVLLKRMVELDQMPLCGAFRKTSGVWCKYTQLHDEEDLAPVDQVCVPDLADVLREYKQLGSTTQIYIDPKTKMGIPGDKGKMLTETKVREQFKEQILKAFEENKTRTIIAGNLRAVKGEDGVTFNEEQFKADHPELYLKFKTKKTNGRLTVAEIKGRGENNG